MKPTNFWGTFCRMGFAFAIFTGPPSALLWSLCMSHIRGLEFWYVFRTGGLPFILWGGPIGGALFGFTMAFVFKTSSVVMAVRDQSDFLNRLRTAMTAIGYCPRLRDDAKLVFHHSWFTARLTGDISIQLQDGSATLTGPSIRIKKLQRLLA